MAIIVIIEVIACMKKGIIFDLDGTLWDSAKIVVKAFNDEIKNYDDVDYTLTEEVLKSQMGKTAEDISKVFFPNTSRERAMELMKICDNRECRYLSEYGGKLYPNLEKTLGELTEKGITLYIVSNCGEDYIEAFFKAHNLSKYFADTECHGGTGLSKGENIKLIFERNGLDNAVYAGDTQGDCDAAHFAGLPFVWAEYGFGKVNDADYTIDCIGKILEIADNILK